MGQQTRGEYRHVTTLFLNLRDVDTHQQLLPFAQTIFALQRDYGGYLNTINYGDKGSSILLFWGMPRSHENDVERALNFALALREQTSIPFKAGVTYRLMYAGFVGASRWRQEYSCYGRGVNLAARLMVAAPWGEIWTDQAFARRSQSHFDLERRGEFAFKGFADPQPVYTLNAPRPTAQPHFSGRTVGRGAELAHLAEWIRPLLDGRFAGALLLWGEAGIGKTRLVHSFRRRETFWHRHRIRPQWFHCQADQILRRSLNPFHDLLHRYFRQDHGRSRSANLASFEQRFTHLRRQTADPSLRQELVQAQPYLQSLLHLTNGVSPLGAQAHFENMQLALQTLLQAESRRRPLILHLEDIHWLDEDTRRFLPRLIEALRPYPAAILLTGREALPPTLTLPEPVQELKLGSLRPAAVTEVARQLLGHPPSPHLRRLLIERSDGNPFFTEQILLYLQSEETLPTVETSSTGSLLPMNVRAVLVARLDQLAQTVREVVQRAAVLGREFDVKLLSHMLQDDEKQLERWIQEAEDAAIWESLTQLRYIFRHAMLRDAAYDMQLQARRKMLHGVAAEAIRQLYAGDLVPHYGELVYHYNQAGDEANERYFAQLAGQRSARNFANAEAIRYLSRALALTPDTAWETRADLLLCREEVYHVQGKREAQEEDLAALADPRLEGDARLALGRALWWRGDYRQAQAQLTQALTRYQQIDHALGAAEVRHQLGTLAYQQGKIDVSRTHYRHALTVYREMGDQMREGNLLNNLGNTYYFEGRYLEALQHYAQALSIRQRIGHRQGVGGLLLNMAVCRRGLGQFEAAQQRLEEALQISREIGERNMESVALINLTLLYHEMGRDGQALRYGRRALAMARQIEVDNFTAFALTWLAHAETALGQGNATQAYRHAEAIYDAIRQDPELTGVIQPLRLYLTCYRGLNAVGDERAAEVLAQAHALLRQRAALIDDEEIRRRFHTAVFAHRQINQLWQQRQ